MLNVQPYLGQKTLVIHEILCYDKNTFQEVLS